jgi:23S rRNA (guanosine2251-2'-O)-methyltransferase
MRKLSNEELDRLTVESFKEAEKIPLVVVLDNVRSMNNIGSVFRTSDAFLVQAIYLCGITATPPHKEIHKTALGATESVDWFYYTHTAEAVRDLRDKGFVICSVEQVETAEMLDSFKTEEGKKYALIFGNEMRGVEQDIVNASDMALEIPQYGTKHSLNISVSAGLVIWEFFRQIKKRDRQI